MRMKEEQHAQREKACLSHLGPQMETKTRSTPKANQKSLTWKGKKTCSGMVDHMAQDQLLR